MPIIKIKILIINTIPNKYFFTKTKILFIKINKRKINNPISQALDSDSQRQVTALNRNNKR
ncbi:hypothetical protein EAN55_07765 [Escherichia albertii]|nr:hypothetical protein [Escherichia albertii]